MSLNKKHIITALILPALAVLLAFTLQPKHITIYLAGDSTMADKDIKAYPETGWGTPFKAFFDTTVTIVNKAKNGRSTKSFAKDWESITDNLKAGDYVLIQFGHNDEIPTKANATTEVQFKENLLRFVTEARAKQAIPVLITAVARRKFDEEGKLKSTHDVYSDVVRKLAAEQKVPLIDLDRDSQALLQQFGVENSKMLYNHLAVGEHPNYPGGMVDDTHFNELGARKMAQIVLADIKLLKLDLADRIVKSNRKPTVAPAAK